MDKFFKRRMAFQLICFYLVQQQVIPWLLDSQQQLFRPCDMCVSAPTGSGKTLAFVLPTIQVCAWNVILRPCCV